MLNNFAQAVTALSQSEAVLIGASNGLSICEGLHLFADNQAFDRNFGDFKARYGISCILQGMAYPWPAPALYWQYWTRLVSRYCLSYKPTAVMADLKALLQDKDYFVLTSNGEGHFQACGFDQQKVCEIEGSWQYGQCSAACCDELFPLTETFRRMAAALQQGKDIQELIPRCPHCGAPLQVHVELDDSFIQERAAQQRLLEFARRNSSRRLVILELGVGPRNQVIKPWMMQLSAACPQSTYIAINAGQMYLPPEIADRSCALQGDLRELLSRLKEQTAV